METLGFIWCCTPGGLGSALVAALFVLLVFPDAREMSVKVSLAVIKKICFWLVFFLLFYGVAKLINFVLHFILPSCL